MKRILIVAVALLALIGVYQTPVLAGEVDVLLETLVEKGILTAMEASIIKDETKQRVTKEIEEGKSYSVPTWVQKTLGKGDFRLR